MHMPSVTILKYGTDILLTDSHAKTMEKTRVRLQLHDRDDGVQQPESAGPRQHEFMCERR